jgi:hypothetical protein
MSLRPNEESQIYRKMGPQSTRMLIYPLIMRILPSLRSHERIQQFPEEHWISAKNYIHVEGSTRGVHKTLDHKGSILSITQTRSQTMNRLVLTIYQLVGPFFDRTT